jgi:hypothetical protein
LEPAATREALPRSSRLPTMDNTPDTSPAAPGASPAPSPGATAPARVLRLPSVRASVLLAAAMLGLGVAVGAAIGPAPDASLAGGPAAIAQRLPALLAALSARSHSQASAPAASAAATPPPVTSTPTPASAAAATPTSSAAVPSKTSSSAASSPTSSTPSESEASASTPTGAGHTRQATLPPVTSVWLIELSGSSFAEALAQPAAAPYIDKQLIPSATLISGWSALTGSAFATDAALAEHRSALGAPPPILHSIVQPPCPEGAAGAQCAPGTAGQLTAADEFLKATVAQITPSAPYREHGLIVVTFATLGIASAAGLPSGASTATLTSQPPAGVVLLSPFARAGTRPTTSFNPISPAQSLQALLHR